MFNTVMRDQLSSLLGNNDQEQAQEQVQKKKSSKKKSKTNYLDSPFFSVNSEEKEFLNKHGINIKKDNTVYKNQRGRAKDLLTSYRNSKTTNAYETELRKNIRQNESLFKEIDKIGLEKNDTIINNPIKKSGGLLKYYNKALRTTQNEYSSTDIPVHDSAYIKNIINKKSQQRELEREKEQNYYKDSRAKVFKIRELEEQRKLKKEKAREKSIQRGEAWSNHKNEALIEYAQSGAAGSENFYSNYAEGISKTEKFVEEGVARNTAKANLDNFNRILGEGLEFQRQRRALEEEKTNTDLADKISNDSTPSVEGAKADAIRSEEVSETQEKQAQELAEEAETRKLNQVLSGGDGVHESISSEEGSTDVTKDPVKARIAAKGGIQAENGTFYKPIEGSHEEMVRKRADNIAKIRRGRYTKAGAVAVGALMATGGLVSALNSSRGQQSNAQLYGQQPLY